VLRVVLDINVLMSALLSPAGTPAAAVSAWREGRFDLVLSATLVRELEDVTPRPHLRKRISADDLRAFLSDLCLNAILVDGPPSARHVPRDPDDDYLVALALAANAHAIVTGDSALLGLELESPRILTPRDFLTALGA
jgi:uncharacterized protein